MANGTSFFARYIDEPEKERPISPKIQHAQRLLDFLQRWPKPTVWTKDILIYGPRPRDRKNTIDSTTILVEQGWLVPNKTHRYDAREWQIVRKPIINPTLAKLAD
jgi:hypothetical protein